MCLYWQTVVPNLNESILLLGRPQATRCVSGAWLQVFPLCSWAGLVRPCFFPSLAKLNHVFAPPLLSPISNCISWNGGRPALVPACRSAVWLGRRGCRHGRSRFLLPLPINRYGSTAVCFRLPFQFVGEGAPLGPPCLLEFWPNGKPTQ